MESPSSTLFPHMILEEDDDGGGSQVLEPLSKGSALEGMLMSEVESLAGGGGSTVGSAIVVGGHEGSGGMRGTETGGSVIGGSLSGVSDELDEVGT